MKKTKHTYRILTILLCCLLQLAGMVIFAQDSPKAAHKRGAVQNMDTALTYQHIKDAQFTDTLPQTTLEKHIFQKFTDSNDSIAVADSIAADNKKKMLELTADPTLKSVTAATDTLTPTIPKKAWVPNPTKATWLALVIPGGGQIYNRKYWKLPIFYGGFAGCAYALTWNSKMYKDYSNAYKDAVRGNWQSSSIQDLLPPGYTDRVSTTQLTETLRKRKDTYRRYRDLSIFAFIGVYLLSVVDAYVDAELSNFDISPDLSMHVEPAVLNNSPTHSSSKSVGVQCSFRF